MRVRSWFHDERPHHQILYYLRVDFDPDLNYVLGLSSSSDIDFDIE
jgi:hypothetical protein